MLSPFCLPTLTQPQHRQVSHFPEPVVTDCHALCGIKPWTFTLSHFWRPEVQSQDVWRAVLPPKSLEQNPSSLFPTSGGSWHWLACGNLTPVSASMRRWPPPLTSVCQVYPSFLLQRHLFLHSGPTLIPGRSHLWVSILITSANNLFPNKVTSTRPGI